MCLSLKNGSGRSSPAEVRLQDVLSTIRAYGQLDYTIYTDGSVLSGVRHGGCAAVVTVGDPENPVFRFCVSRPGPEYASSYETELEGLKAAVLWVLDQTPPCRVLICTDSLSSLAALKGDDPQGHSRLQDFRQTCASVPSCVWFQWVPAHVGLPGNEWADRRAVDAAQRGTWTGSGELLPISFEAAKGAIKRGVRDPQLSNPIRREVYSGKRGSIEGLDRNERKLLRQLRSGHCRILRAYEARISGGDATCLRCGDADETLEHFIRECPATEARRVQCWGEARPSLGVLWERPLEVGRFLRDLRVT